MAGGTRGDPALALSCAVPQLLTEELPAALTSIKASFHPLRIISSAASGGSRLPNDLGATDMLQAMTAEEARRIAALAKVARDARDAFLGSVPEEDLGEEPPARGEHNPTAALGFSPLPPEAPPLRDLREAVDALSSAALAELLTLVRIGQTDLAAGDWDRVLADTLSLGDDTIATALLEDPDLHEHIVKGLYELKAA
jgi:hypothetical protein